MRNKRNNIIANCIRYLLAFTLFITTVCIENINVVAAESYFWPTPAVTQLSQKYSSGHKAIDIATPEGTNIYATKSGTIIGIGTACSCIRNMSCSHRLYFDGDWEEGIGSEIIIKHDDGSGYSIYAHMTKDTWPADVFKGAHVSQGQFIGQTGESGKATGPHLHFVIMDNSSAKRWECNRINNNTDSIAYVYSYNGLGGSTQTSIFTNATAESITESGARIKADMDSVRYLSTAGVYFGTDPSNMQKITENVNGNAQGLFYDTAKWIGTLQSNTTYWYQLYVVTGGNEYKTDLKSFTTTSVWTDAYTEGITETNAVIKGTTNNNKYVTTAGIYIGTDASNMHKVVENVNADAKWYVYDLNKWYGILKPGTTYVYQLYTVYDGVEHKSNLNSFTTADSTAPVISSVEVTDVSSTGYTISCVVSDNGNVARVCFPTWTEANGQDDIESDWYNNTAVYTPDANGRYSFRVNTSDHNYESGKYITLICAYDGAGNNTWAGGECTIYPLQSIGLSLASQSLTVGEQFTLSVSYYPTDTTDDKSVAWTTSNSNVATVNNGTVQAVGVGTATITATAAGKSASCIVTVKEKASKPDSGTADDSGTTGGSGSMGDSDSPSIPYNGWYTKNGKSYWYENGVRQGYDPNNAAYRGKEIYDPGSDAWYWLDNVQQGAKAVSKDVYQESSGGKWVRYDENGHMIKGWQTNNEGTYYFDPVTGAMAKGNVMIDGTVYSFDVNTGILQSTGTTIQNGWLRMDGKDYWYENGVRQGYDPNNPSYRGKEIYDPGTDAWYWLDNVQQGAKAVSKDVYQESYSAYPDRADGTGKWVRYDENGHMVKGWQTTEAGTYYFETITGSMAKGSVTIDGVNYYFDPITGVKQ